MPAVKVFSVIRGLGSICAFSKSYANETINKVHVKWIQKEIYKTNMYVNINKMKTSTRRNSSIEKKIL